MQVYFMKNTVHTDAKGRQTRIEHRTDWTFGTSFCAKQGTPLPTVSDLETDYDLVFFSMVGGIAAMDEHDLDDIFHDFQAEFMPRTIKRQVMAVYGRSHTSMSVGDIVVDDNGNMWICDSLGWTLISEAK